MEGEAPVFVSAESPEHRATDDLSCVTARRIFKSALILVECSCFVLMFGGVE